MRSLRSSLVVFVALAGCGVSVRYAVESDMRFEHCYRIDEDARYAAEAKRVCWADWRDHYSRGQDRSRIAYAEARLHALDPTVAIAPESANYGAGGPAPTSAYAPPPPVVAFSGSVTLAPTPAESASMALHACGDACVVTLHACTPNCAADFGCKSACDDRYRACFEKCNAAR